jgi:F-type H+-transporting ATPase subunit epsilon
MIPPGEARSGGRGDRRGAPHHEGTMRLRVLRPTEVLLDVEATRIVAEAANGAFGLLPRHADFVTALVPGVLAYTDAGGATRQVGVDEGVLVKRGSDVFVSVLDAVSAPDITDLADLVQQRFREIDEDERQARGALARLEAGALRRLFELERQRHG